MVLRYFIDENIVRQEPLPASGNEARTADTKRAGDGGRKAATELDHDLFLGIADEVLAGIEVDRDILALHRTKPCCLSSANAFPDRSALDCLATQPASSFTPCSSGTVGENPSMLFARLISA